MNYIPVICDIYKGSNFYNKEKNIIRVVIRFDDTDFEDKVYDVPLISTGIFKNPDFRFNKVIAFVPEEINKRISIQDPENTEIGESNAKLHFGILIDLVQYNKLIGSIGNSSFHVNSDSGTQNIENLDFFLPAGFRKTRLADDPDFDQEEENMRLCGVAGGKDGSILIRGAGGEISIGGNGIRVTGKVQFEEPNVDKSDIIKESPTILNIIPHTLVTPFPPRLPNLGKALSIAHLVGGVTKIVSKISNLG